MNNLVASDLKGKTALIAGGAGKMGQEFMKSLVAAGARVFVLDLKRAIDRLKKKNARSKQAEFIPCDITQESDVNKAFMALRRKTGKLDILISATMAKPEGYYRSFENYSLKTWKGVVDGNLTGTFLLCRNASGFLKKGSSVVFVASIYGCVGPDQRIYESSRNIKNLYGGPDPLSLPAAYSASKAGIIGLSKHLATLWGPRGIRVNVLVPGGVADGQDPKFQQAYSSRTPLGRMAEWGDYNGAIQYLCSDSSRYMTGASLIVDGGWTAW